MGSRGLLIFMIDTCVILAAGEGKRMRPLTTTRSKVMLPLANKPMLEHLIVAAKGAGFTNIILVVGYGERGIREYFGNGDSLGVAIQYVVQRDQRGTADALKVVEPFIEGSFVLLNGDMVLNVWDLRVLLSQDVPCMCISQAEHPEDYGTVLVSDGKVIGLEEKSRHPKTNVINAGAYLLDENIFGSLKSIQPSSRGELELTDAMMMYIKQGVLSTYELSFWMDVRNPWDMLDVNKRLLEGLSSAGEGTLIKPGVVIEGNVVIGNNCVIGPNAYIRGSTSIGDNCHIGHCTEIKNSIIMSGTKVPHFTYIGDSVIGSNCNFGAGTKVANLRHDHTNIKVCGQDTRRTKFGAIVGDNVKFGINCSVNAGTIIGSNVHFAPNTYVSGIIGDDTTIR